MMMVTYNKEQKLHKLRKYIGVWQYIFIYCLISYGGMALPEILGGNDVFYLLMLVASLCYIGMYRNGKINKKFFFMLVMLSTSMIITLLYSQLSMGTILTLIGRLLIVYVTIDIDKENFLKRFLKMMFVISTVSIFIFIISKILGFWTLGPIFPFLFASNKNYEIYSYGGLLYRFVPIHSYRNCGPFAEPGQYQCVLSVALYYTLFKGNFLSYKQQIYYSIVFIIALITTLSTNGYIGLGIVLVCYMLMPNSKVRIETKKAILIFGCLMLVYLVFSPTGQGFIQTTIINKLFPNGTFTLMGGSGIARTNSILSFIQAIKDNPICILGVGYDGLESIGVDGISGITTLLVSVGIISFLILYGFLFSSIIKYNDGSIDIIVRVMLIINTGLGQPNILIPVLVVMGLYDYFYSKNRRLINNGG